MSFDTQKTPFYSSELLDSRSDKRYRSESPAKYGESAPLGPSGSKVSVRPRTLVLRVGSQWIVTADPRVNVEYVFISWHWASFGYKGVKGDPGMLHLVVEAAKHVTIDAGLKAYWLDAQCVVVNSESTSGSASSDVYGMSDIVRGARHVAVLLPDKEPERKQAWVQRLWTLPEGLLGPRCIQVWICNPSITKLADLRRTDLFTKFLQCAPLSPHHSAIRTLAAYFDGLVDLSKLEYTATAIVAFSGQDSSRYSEADMAYAFMGLTSYRIQPNHTDTQFQAMIRLLSLTGDHNMIVERLIASYPRPNLDSKQIFQNLLEADQFGSFLWDVQPRCRVVGVGQEDGVVFLSGCRVMPIASTTLLPESKVRKVECLRRTPLLATLCISLCMACIAASSRPSELMSHARLNGSFARFCSVGSFFVGLVCLAVPWRTTFKHHASSPYNGLVMFDGAVSLAELNAFFHPGSLSYDLVSSPRHLDPCGFPSSEETELRKLEPAKGQQLDLPPPCPGYSIYSLVDTHRSTVSTLQARRRPTVALSCGSEGGLSRAVLCSWDSHFRLLTKEAVLRLPHEFWDRSELSDMIEISIL